MFLTLPSLRVLSCPFPVPLCCHLLQQRKNGSYWSPACASGVPGLLPAPSPDGSVRSEQRAAGNGLLALRKLSSRRSRGGCGSSLLPVGCPGWTGITWLCPSLQSPRGTRGSATLAGGYRAMLPARIMKPSLQINLCRGPPLSAASPSGFLGWFSFFFLTYRCTEISLVSGKWISTR